MRWIKDSVHGDIFINSVADALLDSETMQRLRRVAQTSFSNMIYPGANHTRFEHSIGVYYLTSRSCFLNNIEKKLGSKLVIAGLLHDIGHTAFSHALEKVLIRHTGKNHEDYTREKIRRGEIAGILEAEGVDPLEIAEMYDKPVGKAILSYLGTDKMDYLLRDSHYTGVAYGAVDADRILRKLQIREEGVLLEEKGVSAAEAMLMARFLMYSNVYFHHVAVSAENMLIRAVEDLISRNMIKAEDLPELDDWQVMHLLIQAGGKAGELAHMLQTRKCYKTAIQKRIKDFRNWLYIGDLKQDEIREAEEEIAARAGVESDEIILSMPRPWFNDVDMEVIKNGELYSLNEISFITRLLKEAQWDYLNVLVFCPSKHREAVSRVDISFLEEYGGD